MEELEREHAAAAGSKAECDGDEEDNKEDNKDHNYHLSTFSVAHIDTTSLVNLKIRPGNNRLRQIGFHRRLLGLIRVVD